MISQKTKHEITKVVRNYKQAYPDEYAAVIDQIRLTRQQQINEFAATDMNKNNVIEQLMYEIPETLYVMLKAKLSEHAWKEFQDQNLGGPRWFAQTFKEFAIARKI